VSDRSMLTMNYLKAIPHKLRKGRVLVHNSVVPARRLNWRGFRAWTQRLDDTLELCRCDWAGVDLRGLAHYSVKSGPLRAWPLSGGPSNRHSPASDSEEETFNLHCTTFARRDRG
jgi:hypothetical protein